MRWFTSAFGFILAIVCILGTRLIDPVLTETQLLQRYWPVYLLSVLVMLGAYSLVKGKAE